MSTNSTRIYKSLSERIINGSLLPGQKLDEKTVARHFGVSRTPVREALRELSARGLVEFNPRRGGAVAQLGIDSLTDMLDAECELEALCAQLASQRMSAIEKGQLQNTHDRSATLVKRKDKVAYLILNQEFHATICAGAHNKTLDIIVRDLRERLAPFRQAQSVGMGERLARSHQEHANVVQSIIAGDKEAAYEAMRNHNARLSTGVLRLLRQHRDMEVGGDSNATAGLVPDGRDR